MRQQVEEVCRDVGARCIPVENRGHRYVSSASQRHCDTMRYVMEYIRKEGPGWYWMLDSDMWPIAAYTMEEIGERCRGSGTFVRQERDRAGSRIVYAWPNLWWLNIDAVSDLEGLCWDLAPSCDTGGASATWMNDHGHAISWLPTHRGSCRWSSADIPKGLEGLQGLRVFLDADPRNKEGKYWTELYDDRIFHVRAGSNWNGEGVAIHQRIAEMVKLFFA